MAKRHHTQQALRKSIDEYVESYRPLALTDRQWETYGDQIRTSVMACHPRSPVDAKTLLSSLCRFLADTNAECAAIQEAVTVANVNIWLNRYKADGRNIGTGQNHAARLRRWLTALHPATAPAVRHAKTVAPTPYTETEIATLAAADPLVKDVLACGIAFGVTGHRIIGARRTGPVLIVENEAVSAAPGTDHIVSLIRNTPLPLKAWDHARKIARKSGVDLTKPRLRATWASILMATPMTARELVALGLSPQTLHDGSRRLSRDVESALKAALEEISEID